MKAQKMWAVPWSDTPIGKDGDVYAIFARRESAQGRSWEKPIPVMVTFKIIKPKAKKK